MNRVKMKELFFKKKINGRNYFKRESCEKITCEELNHMEINGSCGEKKKNHTVGKTETCESCEY